MPKKSAELPVWQAADAGEVSYAPLAARDLLKRGVEFDPEELRPRRPLRVMFVTPPGSVEISYGKLAKVATELPWLGMAYVAASSRACGHDVIVRDYEAMRLGYDAVADDIKRFQPDVVAMATFVTHTERCVRIARLAKQADPKIKVILGGPQATIFPGETADCPEVDVVIRSEAEISFNRVLQAIDDPDMWRHINGIVFHDTDGKVVQTPPQPLISNLDCLPMPALDLYDLSLYYPAAHIRGKKVANYVSSRGCPFQCTYCEAKMTFGRTFRYHSTDRVVADIEHLITHYGYDSIQFYDDIFTTNRKRVVDLCQGFLRMDKKFSWMCWTRTDLLDRELLELMKASGCYLVVFGCESGDDEMLARIKKGLTVEQNYEGIALAHDCGLQTLSSFMLGLPGETPEMSRRTIEFALTSKLDYAIFNTLEPYPGTEIWDDALANGYFLEDERFANAILTNFKRVWVPNGRTRQELLDLADSGYRRFFLRPKAIWHYLKNLPHLGIRRFMRTISAGFSFLILGLLPFYKPERGESRRFG